MKKLNLILSFLALLMITGNTFVNAQRITVTIAGSGSGGFGGDGGYGRHASVSGPYDVCVDAAKNVYFTDQGNNRVRKISSKDGVITTVAGGGTSTLDGIPATNAILTPKNMCIDAAGNLYIVSSGTNQIKKVNATTHYISTIAGNGTAGYSGDGGAALSAAFKGMAGICIDPTGNLYVVDSGNFRVRKIAAGTGIVTTIAGAGTGGYTGDGGPAIAATLNMPTEIAVNAAGDVFFMDQSGVVFTAKLRKISASTGIITTVAGASMGGAIFDVPLMSTWLADVTGLCIDGDGNFYCNEISCSCRKLDMTTDSTYAVGGNFSIESFSDNQNSNISYMNNPFGICIDGAKTLYTADKYNNRIRKLIQLTSTPTFAFGKGVSLNVCGATSIDSQLAITDLDASQPETWTVLTTPLHGTLSGFPATSASNGTTSITLPSGAIYTGVVGYTGTDSFRVRVSDGILSDTVTLYTTADGVSGTISGPSNVCIGSTVSLFDPYPGGTWLTYETAIASVSSTGDVTGITPGVATIQYTVNNSCGLITYTRDVTVDMDAPATAGFISGPESVCIGAPTAYLDTTAGGVWSIVSTSATISSTGVVTGTSTGTAVIDYVITNGCGSAAASSVISVLPLPNAGLISGTGSVCVGNTITLNDGAVGGIWSASNGHSSVSGTGIVTGLTPGTDTILYTVGNSCGSASAKQIILVIHCSNVGVANVTFPVPEIFPNPASAELTIQWDGLQNGIADIIVSDLTGRVVLTSKAGGNGSQAVVNVSSLNEGIYLLTINTAGNHFTEKITIKK